MNEKLMTEHAVRHKRRNEEIVRSYDKMMAAPGAMTSKVLNLIAEANGLHPCTVWRIIKKERRDGSHATGSQA